MSSCSVKTLIFFFKINLSIISLYKLNSSTEINIDCIKIAESGIKCKEDFHYINNIGYDGALIGTSFMKSGNPGNALADMLGRIPQ